MEGLYLSTWSGTQAHSTQRITSGLPLMKRVAQQRKDLEAALALSEKGRLPRRQQGGHSLGVWVAESGY